MTCSLCARKARARGWCQLHYHRWLRHGDPLVVLKGGSKPPGLPLPGVRHGTDHAYSRAGCRCAECRAEHARLARERLARVRGTLAADDPAHGTPNGYKNYGCRCFRCCLAKSKADRAYRERKRAA